MCCIVLNVSFIISVLCCRFLGWPWLRLNFFVIPRTLFIFLEKNPYVKKNYIIDIIPDEIVLGNRLFNE